MSALIAKANEQLQAQSARSTATASHVVTSQPERLKTVYEGGYSSRYRLTPQAGLPLVNYEDSVPSVVARQPTGGGKEDSALDASLRANIQDYPDAPCDCACPFTINNILRDDVKASTRHWRTHFEKQSILLLMLSFLFLLDDLGDGHTHLWYTRCWLHTDCGQAVIAWC